MEIDLKISKGIYLICTVFFCIIKYQGFRDQNKLKDAEDLLASGYNPLYRGVYYPRYFNIDAIANDMLAESEDSPKANWYYTPSKRKTFSNLMTKISETKNGG